MNALETEFWKFACKESFLKKTHFLKFFQRHATSSHHNSTITITRRKFITKWSLCGMSRFHFYRWHQLKVIPVAWTLRTRKLPKFSATSIARPLTARHNVDGWNRTLFHTQIFLFNFGMPFEVHNFAIRTWNVVLVYECCVLVVEERSFLGIYSLTFGTPLNSGILRSRCRKCRFCLRMPFLSQKVVCIARVRWPLCATISRALRAENCIVGIRHNTAI